MREKIFIVVLGGGIDLEGNLPNHVYQRLDRAIQLHQKHQHSKIICSGKFSFLYTDEHPPITESEKMAQYMTDNGIDKKCILKENKSKDTISNAYFLKKDFFLPNSIKKGILITSSFHIPRVKYIFNKVFGPQYVFKIEGVQEHLSVDEEEKVLQHQKVVLLKTKDFLSTMKDGQHEFLYDKFFNAPFYVEKRPSWVVDFVAQGK